MVVLVLLSGLLALPAIALAGSGGSGLNPPSGSGTSPGSTGSSAGTGPAVQPGNVTVSATGGNVSLTTRASTMLRNQLTFSGRVGSGASGKTVQIERLGHETGWRWATTVKATVRRNGSFSTVWHTNHIGRFSIRAVLLTAGAAKTAATAPTVTITVYRPAIATLYGPGFYGQRTACGERLRRNTIGVANRTLPCGSKVAVYYHGRTMVIPVIDRGPYANHADWDLTEATGRALGINETVTLGAVSLPRQP